VTYEGFAAAWPGRTDEVGFADKMNSMPKYVVSTTLKDLTWENSTLIDENAVEQIKELKQGQGGDILVAGSRTLVQTLTSAGLVDEYRLMMFPIVLGSGKRLFDGTGGPDGTLTLSLADCKRLESGTLILIYRPAETPISA
jgi:dihydrofolate reductase